MQKSIVLACVLVSTTAHSSEIEKRILVTSYVEHDSNPAMSVANKNPSWVYSLLPKFQLDIKDDLSRWYVDAGLEILRYSNEKAVANQDNPIITAGWERSYDSGMLGIKAAYQERTARNEELNNTGVFNSSDNKQTSQSIGANWQHRFAPRWTVATDAVYSDVSYSVVGALEDYTLLSLKSRLGFESSEKLTTYVLAGYSKYEPDLQKHTNLYRTVVGADYQVNEALIFSPRIGAFKMSGRQSDSDWEGGLKAEYNAPTFLYSASIARDVEDSGLGFRIVDSARLGIQYNITERDAVGADYAFSQFKRDASINIDKLDAQSIGVFYAKSISEQWTARAYVKHSELEFSGSNPKANVIGFTFVFNSLSF